MAFNVGDTIGDYQVVGILGAGGMGKVYKVRNVISDRMEAMKILLPNLEGDPELMDRFLREIKVQASLDHPNIAGLHTAQRAGNQLLMIMEFLEGEPLESVLQRGPIPMEYGVDFVCQVLAALSYAHARGVVHRDIKPANIMLMPDGTVKLMDFGIAKLAADRRLTQTGRTVGSLYYMSPEQINGAELDGRSDLYSLGVALYEIVTGRRPFQGDSDYSIMAAHLQAAPPPPIDIDPRVPAALNEVILMAIAKDPALRFQSADAFRAALENVKNQLRGQAAPPAYLPPAPPPAQPARSRRWLYMVAGSLATIAVLVFAAIQVPKWRAADAGAVEKEMEAPAPQMPAETPPPAPEPQPEPAPAAPPVVRRENATPPPPRPLRPAVSTPAPAPVQEAAPAPAPEPPPAPRGPDPAVQAELRQLRERMMLQATRLTSSKAAIDNLRRVQAQSGLGMRQDVLTAMQRAEFYMDESESSLKAGDSAAARKNLDSAERQIERLEKFLGR